MKRISLIPFVILLLSAAFVSADTFGTGANQFTLDFVSISGASNPTSGIPSQDPAFTFIGVNYNYRIGTYEITNDQWNKFTAAYGTVTGSPLNAYDNNSTTTGLNPINNVSWYEAAQFANYLNTSTRHQAVYKFTGTIHTGDYTLAVWDVTDAGYDASNPYRNKNAFYFLPTENEWVKAAYWNGTNLQTYANASVDDLISGKPDPTKWNYYPSPGSEFWAVGRGVEELNGTYDMMGNIYEWMESSYSGDYLLGSPRVNRGGSYFSDYFSISSGIRSASNLYSEDIRRGFRVASIPEPATVALLAFGGLAVLRKRKI